MSSRQARVMAIVAVLFGATPCAAAQDHPAPSRGPEAGAPERARCNPPSTAAFSMQRVSSFREQN